MEEKTGIKQQAISRLENPYYGKATLTTLKRIAAAFDVGLLVEFVPFSQLINRVSGTPYVERGFSPETMNPPNFDEEERQGVFEPENRPILGQMAQVGHEPHEKANIIIQYGSSGIEPPFRLRRRPQQPFRRPHLPLQRVRGLGLSAQKPISMGGMQ